jgi:methyl-accepting chemotaxis protein
VNDDRPLDEPGPGVAPVEIVPTDVAASTGEAAAGDRHAVPVVPVLGQAPPRTGSLRWLPTVVIVAGVLSMLIGLVVVDQLGDRTRNIIDITVDGAEVVEAAADPIAGLPADVAALAEGVATSLAAVRDVADTAGVTAGALGEALGTNVASIATSTASVADRVADVIETIERFVPGDVESLGEELRQVSDNLEPVAGQLGELAVQLESGVGDIESAAETIEALEARLSVVAGQLAAASEAVQDLPSIAADIRFEAEDAREDLAGTLWLFRLLVVVTGAAVVAIGACLRVLARMVVAPVAEPPPVATGA